jgi:hypothetical protein
VRPKQGRRATSSAHEATRKLRTLIEKDSPQPGDFGEAARLTLAIFRTGGGVTTKTQRAAQVREYIDGGLLEDLAKYPLPLLRRLRKLVPTEIHRREKESPSGKFGDKPKAEPKVMLQAVSLHDIFVRHGLSSDEADELAAAFLDGVSVRTVQRYRTEFARKKASAK